MGKAEGCGSYGCHYEKHVFNCDISWVVIALGGLYFVDSIWGLPVRQIRFHRTAATWDHKEDIKTTSALLSTNMPIIEWFNLEPDNKKSWTNMFVILWVHSLLSVDPFLNPNTLLLRLNWSDSSWWMCPLVEVNADVAKFWGLPTLRCLLSLKQLK